MALNGACAAFVTCCTSSINPDRARENKVTQRATRVWIMKTKHRLFFRFLRLALSSRHRAFVDALVGGVEWCVLLLCLRQRMNTGKKTAGGCF